MRLVFVSIEFSAGTFSGNGIYATSQVCALAALGHKVLVIAGKPPGHALAPEGRGACSVLEVELPSWGRLDRVCAWREFAEGVPQLLEQVTAFNAQAVLGVDWTSLRVYETLAAGLAGENKPIAPYVFMNYRIYMRTAGEGDRELMHSMEADAAAAAVLTTVLSRSDADFMVKHLMRAGGPVLRPRVLLPALRMDLAELELATHAASQRFLLTCAVRLSPEKDPMRFAEVVEHMAAKGALKRLQVTPLLLGSAQTLYASEVRARFRAAAPGVLVEDRFLGAAQLAKIYAQTRLNCHFCLYDAFGMTIVEAASQGAPSIFNRGGAVGAGDLLSAVRGEAIELDMSQPVDVIADNVIMLLSNPGKLATVGAAAAVRARAWTQTANAAALAAMVEEVVPEKTPSSSAWSA